MFAAAFPTSAFDLPQYSFAQRPRPVVKVWAQRLRVWLMTDFMDGV